MMTRLLPVFAVLIAIVLFFTYISPTYSNKIIPAQQKIASYDSALAASSAFTAKENDLLQKRNAISPDNITHIETFLPNGVDNIQLILDLNALAARSGILLSDFSVHSNQQDAGQGSTSAATPTPFLQSSSLTNSLDLSVTATGTYTAFQSFLQATEQSLRPLDVVQLSLKDSKTTVYSYNVTFRIYWLH
jgi:hypothetical protein